MSDIAQIVRLLHVMSCAACRLWVSLHQSSPVQSSLFCRSALRYICKKVHQQLGFSWITLWKCNLQARSWCCLLSLPSCSESWDRLSLGGSTRWFLCEPVFEEVFEMEQPRHAAVTQSIYTWNLWRMQPLDWDTAVGSVRLCLCAAEQTAEYMQIKQRSTS